jgi:cardiolipin synthase C
VSRAAKHDGRSTKVDWPGRRTSRATPRAAGKNGTSITAPGVRARLHDGALCLRALRVLLVSIALGLLLSACANLPERVERVESTALTGTESTRLGQVLHPELAAHLGKSGIYPLGVGMDAFAARILLANGAERSLDVQYYIWHGDTTGQLMWQALWQAAERGVRVRLLLDDANTGGLDPILSALAAHPNIEVRLFNPFANRGFRAADFAGDFSRVNRRMHNKSFTGDNQMSIVGGRNIGNEYFGADLNVGFQDLDVLAVGPVVNEISAEFDRYWRSESAYPVASLLGPAPTDGAALLNANWQKVRQDPQARRYIDAVRQTPIVQQVAERKVAFEWATAHVLTDDPEKVRFSPERGDLQMMPRLSEVFGNGERELNLVSPYFVPGKDGSDALANMARRGVKVRVLTNSLAATDVAPVHAGYAKYRKELLESGVVLYELKPGAANVTSRDADAERTPGVPGSGGSRGSSAASLHAKTFAVDGRRVFVGSFNLDPRSARLNTEMGVVIESAVLAQRVSSHFDSVIPDNAYQVRLQPDGSGMEWIERGPTGETRYTDEPGTGPIRRLWMRFLSILPIESLL